MIAFSFVTYVKAAAVAKHSVSAAVVNFIVQDVKMLNLLMNYENCFDGVEEDRSRGIQKDYFAFSLTQQAELLPLIGVAVALDRRRRGANLVNFNAKQYS